ncbi:hypothetical protein BCR36DRAFT_414799 [Piromyces finnis]|uniref:Uncharacterized protein n=1 Tax=Piromyces finnis TaxID=1754191 RepID=A0A1Y1V0U4_9FUNG|nr:hypothetical protein BCR36DRAFT_414799 [Piromyces finnis]|eukprot:ORX44827.1 hypothetical protein BCR36DRAFT_414799 [Piromyces finnis]
MSKKKSSTNNLNIECSDSSNLNNKTLQDKSTQTEFLDEKVFVNKNTQTEILYNKILNNGEIKENEKSNNQTKSTFTDNISRNEVKNQNNNNDCNDTNNQNRTKKSNIEIITDHIYNILKRCIDNEEKSRYNGNMSEIKKEYITVNDTTEPIPGVIQLENTYDKKRYKNEYISVSYHFDPISKDSLSYSSKFYYIKHMRLYLFNNIVCTINKHYNKNSYYNDYYDSSSDLNEYDILYKLNNNCRSLFNNYYNSAHEFIRDLDMINKNLKSHNIEIDDITIKYLKSTDYIYNLLINNDLPNGKEAGDSNVLLKLFLYAQTFFPMADDPSDFCVENAHIIPDKNDYMVLNPNPNVKEYTLFPTECTEPDGRYSALQSIKAYFCDVETFLRIYLNDESLDYRIREKSSWVKSAAIVPIKFNEMNNYDIGWWTIAHLQYPFCTMFHKATIYQGKVPCQLAPDTVGAYTTPSNFTYIHGSRDKVLYVFIDINSTHYVNINKINFDIGYDPCINIDIIKNSLIDGESVDILPSLKSLIPLSSSKMSQAFMSIEKLINFWYRYNGSKRAYDEAFLIASDIFNVYPIGSIWQGNNYLNRWWFPSESNIDVDMSGTLKETCNSFPLNYNQFTTASGRTSGTGTTYTISDVKPLITIFVYSGLCEFNNRINNDYIRYIRCSDILIKQSRLNKIIALTMDYYSQLNSLPYWGFYANFDYIYSNMSSQNLKNLIKPFLKIFSILFPNTTFEIYEPTKIRNFNIPKTIPVELLHTTPMARIDSEWAEIFEINEIPQSTYDIVDFIEELKDNKSGESISTDYTLSNFNNVEKLIQRSYSDKLVIFMRRGGFSKNWNNRDTLFYSMCCYPPEDRCRYTIYTSYENNYIYIISNPTVASITVNNPFLCEGQKLLCKDGHYSYCNGKISVYPRSAIPLCLFSYYPVKIDFYGLRNFISPGNWYIYTPKYNDFDIDKFV